MGLNDKEFALMDQAKGNLIKNTALSLLAVIIIIYVLFSGPPVGLSDNGDFDRIMHSNGLEYRVPTELRRFIYHNNYYISYKGETRLEELCNALFHIENFRNYPSLQHFFVKLSIGVNILINYVTGADSRIYRIEALGLIYTFLYGLALFALFSSIRIKRQWLDITLKLIIIVMFCDVGYVLYFNSLYGEALQNIFLVFSVAFGIRLFDEKPVKRNYLLFVLSLLGCGWTKFANIPVVFLVLIFLLPGTLMLFGKKNRLFAVLSTTVVLVSLVILYISIPKWMEVQTSYNSVFFGILRNTDEQQTQEYVEALGMPRYMEKFKNTNYYMTSIKEAINHEQFKKDFSKINKFKIAVFYLKHPGYFLEKLNITALNSGIIRPVYLSNYGPQEPRLTFCTTFEFWGNLRKALPFDNLIFNFLIILTAFAYLFYKGVIVYRENNRVKAFLFLGAAFAAAGCALYNFCVPYIANGEGDIAKHMFAYVQSADFIVILLIYLLLDGVSRIGPISVHALKHNRRFIPAAAGVLCVILVICGLAVLTSSRKTGMIGAFIELGEYNGKKMTWQIINHRNGVYTLMAAEPVTKGNFSESVPSNASLEKYGSNIWLNSRIRDFLNEDFIKCFSDEELALLETVNHRVLLSAGNLFLKETGEQEIFWSHVPVLSDRDYDNSYAVLVRDIVTLPNLRQIADMSRNGIKIKKAMPYWLDTPYYSNDSMLRIVEKDGYIYMKDAITEDIGIVPCIYLRSGWSMEGKGTLKEPYRIVN